MGDVQITEGSPLRPAKIGATKPREGLGARTKMREVYRTSFDRDVRSFLKTRLAVSFFAFVGDMMYVSLVGCVKYENLHS